MKRGTVWLPGLCVVALWWSPTAEAAQPSDERLKNDIRSLDPSTALQDLLLLRPVSFVYSEQDVIFPPEGRHLGLLAQEVREVLPEVVQDRGGFLFLAYDELVAVLVGGMQQQQQRLDEQEALLLEQAALIDDISSRLDDVEADMP
ncbi:MAG: tail fiber domain-containing protein [Myxococcota bacterium]